MSVVSDKIRGSFDADPVHSHVSFRVARMGVSVFEGSFGEVSARLCGNNGHLTLEGAARVESISITDPPDFRAHVLGDDFFGAERHPEVAFRSEELEVSDDGSVAVPGELTIKGITRPVTATGHFTEPMDDPFGGRRGGLELEATVDRRDFGMDYNAQLPAGGDALGTDVTLIVRLELLQRS